MELQNVDIGFATNFGASFVLGVCTYIIWKLKFSETSNPRFPYMVPGSIPVMGNLLQIMKYKGRNFCAFAVDFAPKGEAVTGFRILFGAQRFCVNTLEAAKEVFINNSKYSKDRPEFIMDNLHLKTTKAGLFVASGPIWEKNRRIVLNAFRIFGLGKDLMEDKIALETQYLCEAFENYKETPTNPTKDIQRAVANVILSIIYGDRFEYSDDHFNQSLDHVLYASHNLGRLLSLLKKLNRYLPVFSFVNDIERRAVDVRAFLRKNTEECARKYEAGNPRSIVDIYLDEIKKEPKGTIFDLDNMQDVIWELFLAGLDTTSITMLWALVYMCAFREVQEKVQEEIDQELGRSTKPTVAKIRTMNYTMATIYEIQRYCSVTVTGVAVKLTGDIDVGKKTIPKGKTLFTNVWAIHRDPENFKEPDTFNPSRFIDEEGKLFRPEAWVPYGLGPRVCVGKKLANYELMIMFTTIFQKFKVSSEDEIDVDKRYTEMVVFPETYKYKFELR